MYVLIIVLSSLFLGIMIPTVMISMFRGTTIALLEALKFYKKGSLFAEKRSYIAGSGNYRYSLVYATKTACGNENFENGKVFGSLVLIFETVFLVSGLLVIIFIKTFPGI
jgi:hypothetical protein